MGRRVVGPGLLRRVQPHRLHAGGDGRQRIEGGIVAYMQHLMGLNAHGAGGSMKDARIGLGHAKLLRTDAGLEIVADAHAVHIGIAVGHRYHGVALRQEGERRVGILK